MKPKSINLAIFPGTFDPFTNAHLKILYTIRHLYDKVVILVSNNPDKHSLFSPNDRVKMIRNQINKLHWEDWVFVEYNDKLLTDYVLDFVNYYDCIHIIRGLRPNNAAEEFALASIYYDDVKFTGYNLRTIFVPVLEPELQNVSSTRARTYIRLGGKVQLQKMCPDSIFNDIMERFDIK